MKADLILHFGELHSWLGKSWKDNFTHDTEELTLPMGASMSFDAYSKALQAALPGTDSKGRWRPVYNALKRKGIDLVGARVGIMGFSQTCIGVRVLLASADAGVIDFAFANDGIHTGVDVFVRYAELAAYGTTPNSNAPPTERLLVVSHSQTAKPPAAQYSTTESAGEIARQVVTGPVAQDPVDIPDLIDAKHEPPLQIAGVTYASVPGWYQFKLGNLYLLGYRNLSKPGGTSDHIYQSKVIGPRALKHIVAPRWNENEPNSGTCVVA